MWFCGIRRWRLGLARVGARCGSNSSGWSWGRGRGFTVVLWLALWSAPAPLWAERPRPGPLAASRPALTLPLLSSRIAKGRISIAATQLTARPDPGCRQRCGAEIVLSGAVTLRGQGFALSCAALRIRVAVHGAVEQLLATGQVQLELGRVRALAARASVLAASGRVELQGGVKLRDPRLGMTLSGSRVVLSLRDGKVGAVLVHDARAQLSPLAAERRGASSTTSSRSGAARGAAGDPATPSAGRDRSRAIPSLGSRHGR